MPGPVGLPVIDTMIGFPQAGPALPTRRGDGLPAGRADGPAAWRVSSATESAVRQVSGHAGGSMQAAPGRPGSCRPG